MPNLELPLMHNNITREDRDAVIEFLKGDPILTQSEQVRTFEAEWSKWLGVKYSIFVNSGASANLLTMAVVKHAMGEGEVIVPTLTWVSDIASVIQNGLTPVFVDIDPRHLGMATEEVLKKITPKTQAVFLTHVLGYNALTDELLKALKAKNIPLIEDVCESHGATFKGQKLGTYGLISNFSFYYAHHMSTIEGGMICTNDEKLYQIARMLRSHGMVREANDLAFRQAYEVENPDVHPEFIFAYPAYNVRSTEINAVIGRNQLKRLDSNNERRRANLKLFLENLDSSKYRTDFATEGAVNYAFTLVLKEPNEKLCVNVMKAMRDAKVEFRRGLSGGGNQLRQPYLKPHIPKGHHKDFPNIEHCHFYGFYIGNFPDLEGEKVLALCKLLNEVQA
jgi:CDP-4-dehydro-6-deoxyglucose reductase, E1